MAKHIDGEKLIDAIRGMMQDGPAPMTLKGAETVARNLKANAPPATRTEQLIEEERGNGAGRITAEQLERIYAEIKKRLLDELPADPVFLQLLANRPEIILELQPRVITLDGSTLKGRVARLIAGGWFDASRATSATRKELARTGGDPGGGGSLSDVLGGMVRDGFLTRDGGDYVKAVGIKITEKVLGAI